MSHYEDYYEFKPTLKQSKLCLQRGSITEAEVWLERAAKAASELPEKKREHSLSFVQHRLAEVAVHHNEPLLATRHFVEALRLVDSTKTLAVVRIKRDYAEFLRRQGNTEDGLHEAKEALDLINALPRSSDRLWREKMVTAAIYVRFDLTSEDPKKREAAVAFLRELVDHPFLRGYKKSQYELAILRVLIEEAKLPWHDLGRLAYIQRACLLSIKLGNYPRAGEYASRLGGPLPRSLYRTLITR